MSNRREFLKAALVISAGAVAGSASKVFASTASMPAGLIYTRENLVNGQKGLAPICPLQA